MPDVVLLSLENKQIFGRTIASPTLINQMMAVLTSLSVLAVLLLVAILFPEAEYFRMVSSVLA